jgi:hypothetical protein
METANKLIYKQTNYFKEDGEKYRIIVTISLDDDCHNNICDWGITADIRRKNKYGRYEEYMGDYKKIVAGNKAGKNICFMSRGEYADPKIAYKGILMNYWDVYDCMDEVEEPTDDDWLNAVSNLFDSYTYDVENTDVDKFKMSDVMNVYRIINL